MPPRDHCFRDWETGERIGPGLFSAIILGIVIASSVTSVITAVFMTVMDRSQIFNLVTAIVTGVLGVYIFWTYRNRCRPVLGFFLMLFATAVVSAMLSGLFLIPKNAMKGKDGEEEKQK